MSLQILLVDLDIQCLNLTTLASADHYEHLPSEVYSILTLKNSLFTAITVRVTLPYLEVVLWLQPGLGSLKQHGQIYSQTSISGYALRVYFDE